MKISFHSASFEFAVYDETSIIVEWSIIHGKMYLIQVFEEGDREGGKIIKKEWLPNKSNSLIVAREFAKTLFE